MGYKRRQRVIKVGDSQAVTLPKSWTDFHGPRIGEEITVMGDAILVIVPEGYEEKAKRFIDAMEGVV